jgi:superfamily II DNA or RNA helicase
MILRPYQQTDVARIRTAFGQGARRICYQAPTGSGKTVLFVHAARKAVELGQRVVIIVHRQELVDQTAAALAAEGVCYGIIAAGYEETNAPVQIAMAMTLVNRLERLIGVTFLIVDECHHVMAQTWLTILGAAPDARVLGVTATPQRLDGKGLGTVFDTLIIGPLVADLITANWLAPFTVFAPARMVNLKGLRSVAGDYVLSDLAKRMGSDTVLSDALSEYRQHLAGSTAIAFCTTIAHSQATAAFFRANGIEAQHLDGDTPTAERRRLLAMLAEGAVKILTNCSLISEGLDIPSVAGVILLRPTKSLTVYLQQVGRALRPAPGKRAIVLDHAGNCFRFGLPDMEHEWSLEDHPKKKGEALVRRCPNCGALVPISSRACPECGTDLRPQDKPIAKPEPLVALDSADAFDHWLAHAPFKAVIRWAGDNPARLGQVAAARHYKDGWVWHRLQAARASNTLVR